MFMVWGVRTRAMTVLRRWPIAEVRSQRTLLEWEELSWGCLRLRELGKGENGGAHRQVLLVLFSRHYIVTIGALSLLLAGSDQEGTAVLTSQPLCQPPAAGLVLQAAGQADWKSRPEVGRTQMQTAWVIRYIANFTCSWTTFCRLQCSYVQALCSRGHAPFQPTAYAGYSHTCRCRSAEDPKTVVRFNRNYSQLSSEKFSYGPALNVVGLHMSRGDRSRHRAQ